MDENPFGRKAFGEGSDDDNPFKGNSRSSSPTVGQSSRTRGFHKRFAADADGSGLSEDGGSDVAEADDEFEDIVDLEFDEEVAQLAAAYHFEAVYRGGDVPGSPLRDLSPDPSELGEEGGESQGPASQFGGESQGAVSQSIISLSQRSGVFDTEGYCRDMFAAQLRHPSVPDSFMKEIFEIAARYNPPGPPSSFYKAEKGLGDVPNFVKKLEYCCEDCGVIIKEADGRCCRKRGCVKEGVPLHALNCGYSTLDVVAQLEGVLAGERGTWVLPRPVSPG